MSVTSGADKAIMDVVDAYNKAIDDHVEDVELREKVKDAASANIYTAILKVLFEDNIKSRFREEYDKLSKDMYDKPSKDTENKNE